MNVIPTHVTSKNFNEWLGSFDTILSDCDGVLWNDSCIIDGADEAFQLLKSLGKKIFYVTNNSTRSREEYMQKCQQMGFPASEDDIVCTAHIAAHYIRYNLNYQGKVYLIGTEGMKKELENVGIDSIGVGPDHEKVHSYADIKKFKKDPNIQCVLVGFDKEFNYTKLNRAVSYLTDPDCHFIGTNIDSCVPLGDGYRLAGTGSLVRCVEYAADRDSVKIGKPGKPMIDFLKSTYMINPDRTIMIGDRINTDIAFANNNGLGSLMVLSGYSDLKEVQQAIEKGAYASVPSHYIESLKSVKILIDESKAKSS